MLTEEENHIMMANVISGEPIVISSKVNRVDILLKLKNERVYFMYKDFVCYWSISLTVNYHTPKGMWFSFAI